MASQRISETYHPKRLAGARSRAYVGATTTIALFLGGAIIIVCLALSVESSPLLAFGLYVCLAGPICMAAIASRSSQKSEEVERTITLEDGLVTVTNADGAHCYPLKECCWFRGKPTDDTTLSHQSLRRKAVILVLPTGHTVACGLSDGYYDRWLDAVLAGQCRRVLRQEGILGFAIALLSVVGGGAGLYIGSWLGVGFQRALFPRLANNPFANVAPVGLAILGAWLLAILPWFLPGWRRYTKSERLALTRFAVLLPAKVSILAGAAFGGDFASRVALAIVFTVILLIATHVVTRRAAQP